MIQYTMDGLNIGCLLYAQELEQHYAWILIKLKARGRKLSTVMVLGINSKPKCKSRKRQGHV